MTYSVRLLAIAAAIAVGGCAHHVGFHSAHLHLDTTPHYAQPSVIPCYKKSLVQYTTYYGSDEKWHYFESQTQMKLKRYKVPRWSLPDWKPVFPVNKGKLYVERSAAGKLQVAE